MVQESDKNEETEYQFNDAEEGENAVVYEQSSSDTSSPQRSPMRGTSPGEPPQKNIVVMIIMVFITVFIVYKVSALFFGGREEKQPVIKQQTQISKNVLPSIPVLQPSKPIIEQEKTALKEKPVIEDEKIPLVQENLEDQTVSLDKVHQQIVELQGIHQQLTAAVESQKVIAHANFESLDQKMDHVTSEMRELQGVLQDLATQVQTQEKEQQVIAQQAVLQQQTPQKAHSSEEVDSNTGKYFVEAVIPGRAWIRSHTGDALTISIGDHIRGYGQVTDINAYSGLVKTNSGRKIYYGVNDH